MAKPAVGENVSCGVFDALRVKIRDEGTVKNKAVYLALGVSAEGVRDVLSLTTISGAVTLLVGLEIPKLSK